MRCYGIFSCNGAFLHFSSYLIEFIHQSCSILQQWLYVKQCPRPWALPSSYTFLVDDVTLSCHRQAMRAQRPNSPSKMPRRRVRAWQRPCRLDSPSLRRHTFVTASFDCGCPFVDTGDGRPSRHLRRAREAHVRAGVVRTLRGRDAGAR